MAKVNNINKQDQYPEDYDWLTEEQRKAILDYFDHFQKMADRYHEKHVSHVLDSDKERQRYYLELYNQTMDTLTGAKAILSLFNIMVEYSWPGHNGEWILATKKDWQAYEDWKAMPGCFDRVYLCRTTPYSGWPTPSRDNGYAQPQRREYVRM